MIVKKWLWIENYHYDKWFVKPQFVINICNISIGISRHFWLREHIFDLISGKK